MVCRNEGISPFNKYFGGGSKKGDAGGGDGNAGSGEEGGERRRSSTSLAGRRGVFARAGSSRGGDDDWSPLCAEVCATYHALTRYRMFVFVVVAVEIRRSAGGREHMNFFVEPLSFGWER